jgi:hypothetical protein
VVDALALDVFVLLQHKVGRRDRRLVLLRRLRRSVFALNIDVILL